MYDTLKSTFDMIRSILKSSDININRGLRDFFADRIVQSTTERDLLSTIERLSALMNTHIEYIGGNKVAGFMKSLNNPDASGVLSWLRDYPRVAAMIATLKNDDDYNECLTGIKIEVKNIDRGTALPSADCDIKIIAKCLSPLSHGADTKAGNATIFRRMQVLSTTGQILSLPFYAGNAVRGQIRDLLADHFLKSLDLTPRKDNPPCELWFFHSLYAGGALEENSKQAKLVGAKLGNNGTAKAEGMHEFRNMIPTLSVLGTALGNRVINGRINVCDLRPQCMEWGTGLLPVGDLFEWQYMTRREDHEMHAQGENHSMIANTECMKSGVVFVGGLDISEHATKIELSCIYTGLRLLQEHGYLGAENRRGFGRVEIDLEKIPESELYEKHMEENKSAILQYLYEIGAILP